MFENNLQKCAFRKKVKGKVCLKKTITEVRNFKVFLKEETVMIALSNKF